MSFNNLKYDTNSYKHVLSESVAPLEYQLGTPLSCNECFVTDPSYILQRNGVSVDSKVPMIDIDSELMNITRKLSNNPAEQYLPKEDKDGNLCSEQEKNHPKDCKMPKMEYTKLSNPACNLKGTGWNRWEWLCKDPQEGIITPFYFGTDTRQLSKDNHRPCLPKIVDMNDSLPSPCDKPIVTTIAPVDGVPTGPVSVNWQNLNSVSNY
jgi:hypothetical protein